MLSGSRPPTSPSLLLTCRDLPSPAPQSIMLSLRRCADEWLWAFPQHFPCLKALSSSFTSAAPTPISAPGSPPSGRSSLPPVGYKRPASRTECSPVTDHDCSSALGWRNHTALHGAALAYSTVTDTSRKKTGQVDRNHSVLHLGSPYGKSLQTRDIYLMTSVKAEAG